MQIYINGESSYYLFNDIANAVLLITSVLFFTLKRKTQGVFTRYITHLVSNSNAKFGKYIEFILVSVESLLLALMINTSTFGNMPLGDLVGTGANFFATVFLIPILCGILSLVIVSNPIKQMDVATLFVPPFLFFVKLACYFAGCCWGLPWKYGPYNQHPLHPGNQVPVQAFEAFFAIAMFIFLLWYIKKAKPGTMYPMFMMLYSATRFPVEFLSAAHEKILGPFNTYHFLCIAGFVIGLILFFIMNKFGETFSRFFDKPQKAVDKLIAKSEQKREEKVAEENTKLEAEEVERPEKVKLARAKAKARKK